jgi:hypothetical protein
MINIVLATNDGSGLPRRITTQDGVSVRDFLENHFSGDLYDFTVSLRYPNGDSEQISNLDTPLHDNMRVTLSPQKVDGAVC